MQESTERIEGRRPTELIEGCGMLRVRTLAVHCVHLSDSNIALLAESGASVSHNPHSNMKISSGVSPVTKMIEAGVNVTIGTDGACSNNDLDLVEEMRSVAFLQKLSENNPCVLPATEVLKMATVNGARAIGMEGRLGVIQEGALADIVMFDIEKPHFYPRHDLVATLVYCGKSSDVNTVIVNGRIIVENRELCGVNLDALCQQTQLCVEEILSR